MNTINPRVSFSSIGRGAWNGSKTTPIELYTVLKQCESGSWEGKEKGFSCIFPYVSNCMTGTPDNFDGVLFIDIDHFDEHEDLKGKQYTIFDSFTELCKCMPNLLAMKFSPSGNLHAFVYHSNIKDAVEYKQLAALYMCCLAAVIKKVTSIDLRDYDGVLDTALANAKQKFNVNHTKFQWNPFCVDAYLTNEQKKQLKVVYASILSKFDRFNVEVESTELKGAEGGITVDHNYNILKWNGYKARGVIASAAYFHFNKDVNRAREWLSSRYTNANQIGKQLDSMLRNGNIETQYHVSVERFLFGNDSKKITLAKDEYLSQKIKFDTLTKQWYYIISNTNTGKTEFVKGLTKIADNKIIILQMNKALRDGKKQGIEAITHNNFRWDDIVSKDQIHTTVEGFLRNCNNLDLSEYTVVVDEAHLLQDYSAISGKLYTNRELLNVLPNVKKCIFMSATPKSEIKLYPFEVLEFEKIQEQKLDIITHSLSYDGRGSKSATRYQYMLNYIRKTSKDSDFKSVIFSNKHQDLWKVYGLDGTDYTWFHSLNINDPNVASILSENKVLTDITLATSYLGVGVEIKHEKEIHIWFDIDEGWDRDFITQSIGRPRDAEVIHLHLFYTCDKTKTEGRLTIEEVESIEKAFKHLVDNIDETPTVNLIAAKMTGVYDANFNTYDCKDKVEILKIGQLISNRDYFSIFDIDLLKKLPYKTITVKHYDNVTLNTDGKKRQTRNEAELETHLLSRSHRWWKEREEKPYEEILAEINVFINDKRNAREMLKKCKHIWRSGFNLQDSVRFFESLNKAYDIIKLMERYCKVKSGELSMQYFEGADGDTIKDIENSFKLVETIFNKEYLEYRIDKMILHQPILAESLEFDYILNELLGLTEEEDAKNLTNTDVPYPFNGGKYKETVAELRESQRRNKVSDSVSKANSKTIKFMNTKTGEVLEFKSQTEAAKHFNVSKGQISKVIKSETCKTISDYKPIN